LADTDRYQPKAFIAGNQSVRARDYWSVNCNIARESLSARADGEREPVPAARVDEHLAACSDCRDWYTEIIDQTQVLRRLAGRSLVTSVPPPESHRTTHAFPKLPNSHWTRIALGFVGLLQVLVATAQGLGAGMGSMDVRHAMTTDHLMNESTAWSLALGLMMIAAAVKPVVAAGLAGVLTVFTAILTVYVINDAVVGAVTQLRILSHLPLLLGSILAVLVWRQTGRYGPNHRSRSDVPDDIVLPPNASRGRHLHPTDGSAA
jgi:predicted anti-sigma-YlaC factor YlaD